MSGFGAAVARRLAADDHTVIVNYAGSHDAAEKLVAEIEKIGGKATIAEANVSNLKAVSRMFASAEAAFSGIDVLVNNAGIMTFATLAECDDMLIRPAGRASWDDRAFVENQKAGGSSPYSGEVSLQR